MALEIIHVSSAEIIFPATQHFLADGSAGELIEIKIESRDI
jgi:hypothetical protein